MTTLQHSATIDGREGSASNAESVGAKATNAQLRSNSTSWKSCWNFFKQKFKIDKSKTPIQMTSNLCRFRRWQQRVKQRLA